MAFNMQTYIDSRRILGRPTPAANLVDVRRQAGGKTPMADVLGGGYTSPIPTTGTGGGTPNSVQTEKQACDARGGILVWTGTGYQCDTSAVGRENELPQNPNDTLPPGSGQPPAFIPPGKYDNWTPQDQTPLPWVTMGPYADAFANMLNTPAFGGQTLEELENARIQAMKAGSAESYNQMADEVTQRLNQEAAARGMFSSGARMQNIGEQLGDLQTRRYNEEMAQEAAIRGERPQLLLQERQQRADIANMWGSMDINAQGQNLDGALQGRLMEYDRQFKNGQLSLDAFQGNTNLLGLFLDYQVSRARTNADLALVRSQIDQIYSQMSETERMNMWDMIKGFMGAFGPTIGGQ